MTTLKSSDCNEWPPLTIAEIAERSDQSKMWTIVTEEDGISKLSRSFICKNFQCALDFVAAAGTVAEQHGHHPDLHITGYRNVRVVVYSHGLSALTDNDFNLCKLIDSDVKIGYSPKFLKEHQECVGSEK